MQGVSMRGQRFVMVILALALQTGLFAFVPATARAEAEGTERTRAKVFDRANRAGAPLFLYSHEAKPQGASRVVKNVFTTPEGKEAVVENVEFENGKLKSYQQLHRQLGADGRVDVKNGEVHFTYTRDGKTKTATEKLKDNFIVGPSLVSYLQTHWSQVLKGDDLDVRFAVVDRRETVGFTFKKIKDIEYHGQKAIVVRMKPTSMLIAALVDPLNFTFAEDGSKLLEMDGRVVPKRLDGGKYKDLDAITVYESVVN